MSTELKGGSTRDPFLIPRVRIVNAAKGPGAIAGYKTKVYIDDVDISQCISDVQVHASSQAIVSATLDVVVNEVEFEGDVLTEVSSRTRETLIRLGWTPPGD